MEHEHDHNKNFNISSGHIAVTNSVYFRVIYFIFIVILYILSLLGGIFVCYVIRKHNLIRKKTWTYLLVLTISDTCACFFEIPILCAATIDEKVLEIPSLCAFNGGITLFFSGTTIFTLVAISVHRCRSVTNPLQTHVSNSYRDIKTSVAISVFVAGFFAIAPVFGLSHYTHIKGRKWCAIVQHKPASPSHSHVDLIYLASITIFGFFIPNIIMVTTSLRICCVVRKQRKSRMRIRKVTHEEMREDQRRTTRTMSLILGSYFILVTPTFAYIMIGMAHINVPLIFSHIAYVNLLLQGVTNTAIYCFRHQMFKDELRHWFCCSGDRTKYRERNQSQLFVIEMENVNQNSAEKNEA